MILKMNLLAMGAAAAALAGLAGTAQAQGYGYDYGYEDAPPPPPYVYAGGRDAGDRGGPGCGDGAFTLLGARAGVTVLGVDLGGGAHLSVPTGGCEGEDYGQDRAAFAPRPYAPPPPMAYAPPAYGYQAYGYQAQGYAPPPCGCEARGW